MTVAGPNGGRRIGSRERSLLILLGIVALLAVVYLFLVNAGGDDDELDGLGPTPRPTVGEEPEPGLTTPPPRTDEFFEGKDPFQPLITAGGAGPGNGDGNGATPSPGPTAVPTGGDGEELRRVELLDIFESDGTLMATVEVDDEEFNVAEGDRFADNFRVLDLTKECGTFVFGDERFTLCIGQEVLK